MNAVVATPAVPRTGHAAPGVVWGLARLEARRVLLHPLMLFGLGLWVFNAGRGVLVDGGPRDAFEIVVSMSSFFPGVFAILVGTLVASRDRRAGSIEVLDGLPGRARERILGLILAALAPALLMLALELGLHAIFLTDGRYVVEPSAWHLLQGPITVWGALLLGFMLDTWAPYRGSALVAMVLMVAGNAWLNNRPDGALFGLMVDWALWGSHAAGWGGLREGSPLGHDIYLLGLCGLAGAAALLRVVERRGVTMFVFAAAAAVVVLGAIGQLP